MIALDTNLLVYAHRGAVAEHLPARRAIERAARDPRGWGITTPSVAEFWSVVTHPTASGRPSLAEEAADFLRALTREAGCKLWSPGPGFGERLVELATRLDMTGPRIFDLQIGLTALDHGATEIWTHDRGFVGFHGLRVHDPLQ